MRQNFVRVMVYGRTVSFKSSGTYKPNPRRNMVLRWLQNVAYAILKKWGTEYLDEVPMHQYTVSTKPLQQAIFESAKAAGFLDLGREFLVLLGRDAWEELIGSAAPNQMLQWTDEINYWCGPSKERWMGFPVVFLPHIEGFAVLPVLK